MASALMITSATCFVIFSETNWDLGVLLGRFSAGIGHGFVLVTVFVQASENSSKEFREMLVIIIGALMMFSIYFAIIIINLPVGRIILYEVGTATSANIIAFITFVLAIAAIVANSRYTLESVPFLLKHNYKEEESLYVFSKLRNETMGNISPGVLRDFEEMQAMHQADLQEFGYWKVFAKQNRAALYHGIYSRIVGMMMSSVPAFVVVLRHLFNLFLAEAEAQIHQTEATNAMITTTESYLEVLTLTTPMPSLPPTPSTAPETRAKRAIDMSDNNFGSLFDIESNSDHVQLMYTLLVGVIHGWFAFGFWVTYFANKYNWRKNLYQAVFLYGIFLLAFVLIYVIGVFERFMATFSYLGAVLFLYFLSWPLNIFGNLFLTDGFPITLHAGSIAIVTIVEHGCHILFIAIDLNLSHNVAYETVVVALTFTILGYKLYRRTANTKGLSLLEARLENQRVLLTQSYGDEGWLARFNRLF